jgi:hypothetical protein
MHIFEFCIIFPAIDLTIRNNGNSNKNRTEDTRAIFKGDEYIAGDNIDFELLQAHLSSSSSDLAEFSRTFARIFLIYIAAFLNINTARKHY